MEPEHGCGEAGYADQAHEQAGKLQEVNRDSGLGHRVLAEHHGMVIRLHARRLTT
jgi:hypothetical protein